MVPPREGKIADAEVTLNASTRRNWVRGRPLAGVEHPELERLWCEPRPGDDVEEAVSEPSLVIGFLVVGEEVPARIESAR